MGGMLIDIRGRPLQASNSGWHAKPSAPARQARQQRRVRARYDSAQTTPDNRNHWSLTDALNADQAAAPGVRLILRKRGRYETENNSYAKGIVRTIANDTIGTGPRLQLGLDDTATANRIEQHFAAWARATGLAAKLRTMRMARLTDGEVFATLITNPLLNHPVKLDLAVLEAERVTSGYGLTMPNEVDGIRFDRYGNPLSYRILRQHPGAAVFIGGDDDADVVPAGQVIHYFLAERPEQHRGIPEITPALPLFAQLRRYTLAVIAAAEAVANFSGVLYTDTPLDKGGNDPSPLDEFELKRNMLLTLPDGWKMGQVDPKQPASTYTEFKREILNEIARCLNIPYNIAACNSSGYNYASGRLDHQTYYKAIFIEQDNIGLTIMDRIFYAWMREYMIMWPDAALASFAPHFWMWDGTEHVDPLKEAAAQEKKLKNHTTTLAREYARRGLDWEPEVRQRGKEVSLLKELGLSDAQAAPANNGAQK